MGENHQQEQWKTIDEFPDYAVSNLGRVKRLTNTKTTKTAGRVLKQDDALPYLQVHLSHNGQQRSVYVHRLVLQAFRGPCPANHQASHISGERQDNRLENLAWTTVKDNMHHKVFHGTSGEGERNAYAALSNVDAGKIRALYRTGQYSHQQLAEMFNTSRFNVGNITRKRTYRNAPLPEHLA